MTANDVLTELKKLGSESVKKILAKHGAKEPFYGVKIEDLKKVQKKITTDKQEVALKLFDSGIGDAQYLAALVADGSKMTTEQLQSWVEKADWPMISEYSVPWVTSEFSGGFDLATKWIDSPKSSVACSGWSALSSIVTTWPDDKLDIAMLKKLVSRVEKEIHSAPNRVRSSMNGFIIAVGSYVKELNPVAIATAKKIGTVTVDMNGTACKIPSAPEYIDKTTKRGSLTKKKKTAKC